MKLANGNEILTIGIGQSGIHMLNSFYSTLMDEHKIDKSGKFTGDLNIRNDKLLMLKNNVYFENDQQNNRHIPRAMFMDIDKTPVDAMKSSYLGSLLPDDHFMSGSFAEPCLNWAKGHYTEGAEAIDECVDTVHRYIETCDCPQGFQLFHSISGGWGSGFGTILLLKIRDNYPDRCTNTISIYPSVKATFPQHLECHAIYNSILSVHQLLENSDMCYNIDNGKIFEFAKKYCKLENPTYDDLNFIIAQVLSGAMSTLRFHCEPTVNVTLQSYSVCFVPFPRLHFLSLFHSPFLSNKRYEYKSNVNVMINNLLTYNDISNIKLEDGKMFNVAFVYRSNDENAINKMDEYIMNVQQKMEDDFVQWIPNINVQSSFLYDGDNFAYKKYSPLISTAIVSTTAIKCVFRRLIAQFARNFKRLAYWWWYRREGMDTMEFSEADKNVRDLITEYQDKEDASAFLGLIDEDESDYDEEEDESEDMYPEDEEDEEEDW